MKNILPIGILIFISLTLSCSKNNVNLPNVQTSLQFKWTKTLKGPSQEDEIDAVASDEQGNVYISGKFEDELTIAGQNETITSNGMADIMLVKYDKNGNWQWTKQFGSTQEDNVFDADCDNQGNVVLSGYFQGTVQFDNFTLTSQGGFDMMVLKISPEGNVLWAKNYGGSGHDGGNEVAIGNDNTILVGAQSNGTFEGIANTGDQDAYLLSLDQNGNTQWIKAIKGAGIARSKAIEVDNWGNVYIGGDFIGANFVENNNSSFPFEEFGNRDAYLVSFTSNGIYRWSKSWGNDGVDFCKGIVTTSQNDIYAVGQFQKIVNFNDETLTSTNDSKDLFVWKIKNTGETIWLRHISSSEKLSGAEVAVDTEDNLIFGLGITGSTAFQVGGSNFKTISSCAGIRCPILIKYYKNGEKIDYLTANQSYDGRFGEIAVSNNIAYIDCEVIGGTYTFGNDEITTINNTKDAAIVAIEL